MGRSITAPMLVDSTTLFYLRIILVPGLVLVSYNTGTLSYFCMVYDA